VQSITDLLAKAWRESCSGTVVTSPSAAYEIAHDTEAAGSLALEVNLSRGFAGSRVKFLRMHRRLPSLLIPTRALRSRRPPSRSTLRDIRFFHPSRSLARPFIPCISLRELSLFPLRLQSLAFYFPFSFASRVAFSSYASFPSSGSVPES